MKKALIYALCFLTAFSFTVACSSESHEPEEIVPTEKPRVAFDYVQLSKDLNKDYGALMEQYKDFIKTDRQSENEFAVGGYVKIEEDSLLLDVVFEKNLYGKVNKIAAGLEEPGVDPVMKLWRHYLKNAESLKLGQFLGTKFKFDNGEGGVFQSIEETMKRINELNVKQTESFTIFGVVPLSAYAVVGLDHGKINATVMDSYYTIDYPELRKLIGTNHADFANSNKILGHKINMFGDLYVYFDYAKDLSDNIFTLSVHADAKMQNISEIDAYVNIDHNDEAQQLAMWRMYASHPENFKLGTFQKAFRTDKDGIKRQTFSTMNEVTAYVDAHGRPQKEEGGILSIFTDNGLTTSLVLNADFFYILIKKEVPTKAERYLLDVQEMAKKIDSDFNAFVKENQKYLPEVLDGSQKEDEFLFNGYLKSDKDSLLLNIMAKAADKKVGSFSATLEDPAKSMEAWKYCLENAETLNLGQFQGTKYKGKSGSGLHNKISETLDYIANNGAEGNESYSIFNTISQEVHTIIALVDGKLKIEVIKSYIAMSLSDVQALIGTDFNQFADQYYLVGTKMNFFGTSSFSFPTLKDANGYIFSGTVNPDGSNKNIQKIELSVSAGTQDAARQMEIWKALVEKSADYGLGKVAEAYTTDNWGTQKEKFADMKAVLDYVEKNGRPKDDFSDNVKVVFEPTETVNTSLSLTAKAISLTFNKK